jgi:hypothetical protein
VEYCDIPDNSNALALYAKLPFLWLRKILAKIDLTAILSGSCIESARPTKKGFIPEGKDFLMVSIPMCLNVFFLILP